MVQHRNADRDADSDAHSDAHSETGTELDADPSGRTVFVGTVSLVGYCADGRGEDAATAVLLIDVISAPGTGDRPFHVSTLDLEIAAPASARFVEHTGRNGYHREVPADPFARPGPDSRYWVESGAAATAVRVRDDETAVLPGRGNGRTYSVGLTGLGAGTGPLRFSAVVSAGPARETGGRPDVLDFSIGQRIPGRPAGR